MRLNLKKPKMMARGNNIPEKQVKIVNTRSFYSLLFVINLKLPDFIDRL